MYPTFSQRSQSNSSNMSEYDNIRSPSQEHGPGHVYHINTARTGRYDSADELKTPTPMTPDPYGSGVDVFSESEVSSRDKRRHQQRTASLDRAYRRSNESSSSVSDVDRYGSLDRRGDIVMLSELTPSRFGCKRDSHAEPGDEPSQSQLSPITRHFSDSSDYSDPRTPTNIPQDDRPRSPRYMGPLPGQISSGYYPSGPNWYDNRGPHVSSSRDSSESGDYSYKPRFIADTPTPPMVKHLPAYSYDSKESSNIPAAPPRGTSSQHHSIAVKNYGLETSKPFEMADVYKYSEKFRRQRSNDQYDSEGGSSPNLSRHMPPSPQVARGRRSRSPSPYRQSPHQETPGSPYQVRRPIPADNYGSSSRPQYSTPQSVHSPHGNSAYNSPQNPQSTYSTPQGTQGSHQGAYQHPQSKDSGKSNGPYNNRSVVNGSSYSGNYQSGVF
ncbi:unnamed protein product [Owenia fusiformis]|uniref:Uncharacterized protein n=2 Tax=Owenia fusiformis TaxID=6347 RepID=A0A8J1T7C1_OWEFU|nr:unnamed protein product [Owenia fusiformis]